MKRQSLRNALLLFVLLALTGTAGTLRAETILHHVHGLSFTPDGKSLMVPAHTGLAVYRDGRWSKGRGRRTISWDFPRRKTRSIAAGIQRRALHCATRSGSPRALTAAQRGGSSGSLANRIFI